MKKIFLLLLTLLGLAQGEESVTEVNISTFDEYGVFSTNRDDNIANIVDVANDDIKYLCNGVCNGSCEIIIK